MSTSMGTGYRNGRPFTGFSITQSLRFFITGNITDTAPMFAWIVENTTSYHIDVGPHGLSSNSWAPFVFTVTFADEADAVAFKLRWPVE